MEIGLAAKKNYHQLFGSRMSVAVNRVVLTMRKLLPVCLLKADIVRAVRRIHPFACISLHMTASEPQVIEGDRPC